MNQFNANHRLGLEVVTAQYCEGMAEINGTPIVNGREYFDNWGMTSFISSVEQGIAKLDVYYWTKEFDNENDSLGDVLEFSCLLKRRSDGKIEVVDCVKKLEKNFISIEERSINDGAEWSQVY